MLELTLKETGKQFLIAAYLIKSVTQGDEGVLVWIDLEKPVGYLVKEKYQTVKAKLEDILPGD